MQKGSRLNRKSFAAWNARFVCRYAGWIIAGIALLCAAAYPFAKNLSLHANFRELLPADTESVVNLTELTENVGGTSFLVCVIESPDEATAQAALDQFVEKAAKFPGVDFVDNRTNVPELAARKLLFLDLESVKKLKKDILGLIAYYRRSANPLFIDLIDEKEPQIDTASYNLEQRVYRIGGFSAKDKDSYMRVALIKPSHTVGDFAESRKLFDAAQASFKEIARGLEHPATLGMTGPYVTREGEYRVLSQDVNRTGMLTFFLIAAIMVAGFRNFRCLIYAYLPLGAGIFLTLAFAEFAIGYLNLITAFLVAVLLGMGSDYALHLLVSFDDDLRTERNTFAALERTYTELWKPLFSSMLTTAVAFFAMVISAFEGYQHFGIIAGVGIVISFIVVLYGLPSLIVLGQKYYPQKVKPAPHVKPIARKGIYFILAAGILFSIYCITQIPKAKFNYDFADLQARNDKSLELAEKIGEYFGVQLSPVTMMTPDRKRAEEITGRINAYIEKNPDTSFDFAASLATHVPRQQTEKIAILAEIDEVLEKRQALLAKLEGPQKQRVDDLRGQLKPEPLTIEDLPQDMKKQYEGSSGKVSLVFIYPKGRVVDGKVTKRFISELRSFDFGPDIKIAGDPVIFADVINLLEKDTPVVMTVSFITVIGLLFFHFRRPTHVLWVLAPVLIGFLWMTGLAGASGLHFNFINLVILPSILGVGIDSGIYIFDRYREKRNESFFVSMQKTSKGVFLSSATNIAAFSSLALAQHRGMSSMGILGVFGFLSCMLTAMYLVPSLIEFFELRARQVFKRSAE